MVREIVADEKGNVVVPAELLGRIAPRQIFVVETDNGTVVLRPKADFFDWIEKQPQRESPAIPDEALRRENLYD